MIFTRFLIFCQLFKKKTGFLLPHDWGNKKPGWGKKSHHPFFVKKALRHRQNLVFDRAHCLFWSNSSMNTIRILCLCPIRSHKQSITLYTKSKFNVSQRNGIVVPLSYIVCILGLIGPQSKLGTHQRW